MISNNNKYNRSFVQSDKENIAEVNNMNAGENAHNIPKGVIIINFMTLPKYSVRLF